MLAIIYALSSKNVLFRLNQAISRACLECICHVESGCDENIHCGDNGISCGPYQIQYGYWTDAGSPAGNWRDCVGTFHVLNTPCKVYNWY